MKIFKQNIKGNNSVLKTKAEKLIIYSIIVTIPIMTVYTLRGTAVNMALSDLFLLFAAIFFLFDFRSVFNDVKKLIWVLPGLAVWITVSYIAAYLDPDIATRSVFGFISHLIKVIVTLSYFYIGLVTFKKEEKPRWPIAVWVLASCFVCLFGILLVILYMAGRPLAFHTLVVGEKSIGVFVGTLTDPNLAALYLTVSFYISVLLLGVADRTWLKRTAVISMVLNFICIMLTLSRGGIIGFGCSILLYIILNYKKILKYLVLVPVTGILLFGIVDVDVSLFNGRLTNIFIAKTGDFIEKQGEFTTRLNLTKASLAMGMNHPIFGVGRGNFPLNSEPYFEKLKDDKYKGLIPHNTIAGIFAETGVMGLLLFLSIPCMMLYVIFTKLRDKKSTPMQYIFLALMFGVFVQSLALNIENFRGLWFVLGMAIAVEDRDIELSFAGKTNNRFIKCRTPILIASIILFVFVYLDTGRKLHVANEYVFSTEGTNIDITSSIKRNATNTVRYKVNAKSKDGETVSGSISLIKVFNNGEEKVEAKQEYTIANGYGEISFECEEKAKDVYLLGKITADNDSSISIGDVSLSATGIKNAIPVSHRYILLPVLLQSAMGKMNLIKYNPMPLISMDDNLWAKAVEINFGGKIVLNRVDYEVMDETRVKLLFQFKCVEKMDIDYVLWLHGSVDNINALPLSRMQYGFDNFDHSIVPPTSTWDPGRTYIHERILELGDVSYSFTLGIWRKINDIENRLLLEDGEIGISIGIIDMRKSK